MFDDLIAGGTVIDGTGEERIRADLAIKDGKIAAFGNLTGAAAKRSIDASGKLVTPGFLEILTDGTISPELCTEALLRGITTIAAEGEAAEGQDWPVNLVLLSELPAEAEDADDDLPEKAVRGRTAVPAAVLGLAEKGKLIPGLDADLCIFASEPAEAAPELVMVGGVIAVQDGEATGGKGGKLLCK